MENAQTNTKPRIYVACLAAYNNGILHGVWIDADGGEDEVRAQIARMLAASPIPNAEEYPFEAQEQAFLVHRFALPDYFRAPARTG